MALSRSWARWLSLVLLAFTVFACNGSTLFQTPSGGTPTPAGASRSAGATAIPLAAVTSSLTSTKSVVVPRRDADLTIWPNGGVRFAETWEVEFIGGPFHYAYRWISLGGVGDISDWSVSEDGQAYLEADSSAPRPFRTFAENGAKWITWHFPETTDETRTFILRYTANGAIRLSPNTSEFFWKFIESKRAYTINAAHVLVHLPSIFQADQLAAMTYQDGVETGGAHVVDGQTVGFNGGPFAPETEWEIRLQFPR